jgi:cation diffusion facilitator CzcD-associated flavoprotein CzcO
VHPVLASCDVPSHAYTYPWAPNPDWPRFLAPSKDILAYVDKVVDRLDLAKFIHVNHQVAGCYWNDDTAKWRVTIQRVEPKADWSSTAPLKVLSEFEDECDILLHATGILNRWDYPDIPGLVHFKGRVSWEDMAAKDMTTNVKCFRLFTLLDGQIITMKINGRQRTWSL